MPQLRHFRVVFAHRAHPTAFVTVAVSVGDSEGPPTLVARRVLLALGLDVSGSQWSPTIERLHVPST